MKIQIDPLSDQAILSALRAGKQRRAARLLVRYYGSAIYHLCRARVEDMEQAEDLTQASFSLALSTLDSLRGAGSTLGWLEAKAEECCEAFCRERGIDPLPAGAADADHEPGRISESLQRRLDMLASCL